MPARKKIDLGKVKASLATLCPHCGYQIPPAELRRISTTQVRCPKCKTTFTTSASQSPRTRMYGFFTHGTVPPSRLYSSGFLSLPDHLRQLPSPTQFRRRLRDINLLPSAKRRSVS